MKPLTYRGSSGWSVSYAYLLEDRVEVGTITGGAVERLSRIAYRDARSLVTWRGWSGRWLVAAGFVSLLGLTFGLLFASAVDAPVVAATVAGVSAGLLAWFLWLASPGHTLRFRLDGVRGSIAGAVSGSAAKQRRFLDELVERIEARRAGTAVSGGPSPARAPPGTPPV